jgi:pimeloyl-ACP methyl ester carboxylesterase
VYPSPAVTLLARNASTAASLGGIKHPTLIIWGREDGLTPLAMGQRFNKEIAGSQLFIIEKCGHVPQLEKASEFNASLLKFLGGPGRANQ